MSIIKDNYRIYVISYNSFTNNVANYHFKNKSWAKVIEVKTTRYFENIMYDSWLHSNIDEWINTDYVGTLSWKSNTKISLPELDCPKFQDQISKENPDVVVFLVPNMILLDQAQKGHGDAFKRVWVYLLSQLGYSELEATDPSIKLFWSNYWMAKPDVMLKYIDFFRKAKNILENSDHIQDDIWSNSNYGGYLPKERLIEIFNKPYYPLYLFIMERLPCFFFHQQYKLLSYKDIK